MFSHYKKSILIALVGLFIGGFSFAHAQNADELRQKIDDNGSKIRELEKEITLYQNQVEEISREADTLKNALLILDTSRRKVSLDLSITQDKISNTNLIIKKLSFDINDKQNDIVRGRKIISKSIRVVSEKESETMVETLLSHESISDFFDEIDSTVRFQDEVRKNIDDLRTIKVNLERDKGLVEKKQQELALLKAELADKKKILDQTQQEKNQLLAQTQNKEANYKKIIDEKIAIKEQFEREIYEYESRLKINVDSDSIPHSGSGVLKWPLDKVVITQYFGNTTFATKNPQIYNGRGHSGVDFRATIGTRTKASLGGIVEATGNTDLVKGCYSYGKWVLIKHNNGLSTLYAHLSQISVVGGQPVSTGQTIGYSGNTGYSTGPHLHFGVYATQGIRVVNYNQSASCRGAKIPIADPKAYLNPLSYL